MSTCPNTGVRDFPIKTTVNITDALVASIQESFLINTQWGSRATAPVFQPGISNGMLQEGSSVSNAPSTSTLRLQGNTYTLFSVQICEPQHKDFCYAAEKNLVKAEVLLIFKATLMISEKYVVFAIPILEAATTSPNVYINSLLQERLPGNPISVGSLLPTSPEDQVFFSYSTCLSQVTGNQTVATQARVFVFLKGIRHPSASQLLQKIIIAIGPMGRRIPATAFPVSRLPDGLQKSTMPMPFLLDNETVFGQYLRSGRLNQGEFGSAGGFREDTTSAYKCVPLNPDLQVQDGKIKVDTQKGELLSKVLSDRSADLEGDLGKEGMNAEQFERMLAIALGIAIGLLVLMILAYFISRVTASSSSYAPGPIAQVPSFIKNATPILLVSALVGTLGFVIGGVVVYYAL
jgi:hypothetical protein